MDLREATHEGPRHPWETARFDAFRRVLADRLPAQGTLLDIGAGDAWFSTELALCSGARLDITCCDVNGPEAPEAAVVGRSRIRHVRSLPAAEHDVVLMLDVLEHVEDDRGFLSGVVRGSLKPGGTLLFSVPAWPWLWTAHDAFLQHHRRYRPAEARAVLEGAGLTVLRAGGLFHSLLAPRGLVALKQRLRPPTAPAAASQLVWNQGRVVTAAVNAALEFDARVGDLLSRAGVEAPGLSWWALCTR